MICCLYICHTVDYGKLSSLSIVMCQVGWSEALLANCGSKFPCVAICLATIMCYVEQSPSISVQSIYISK